jgi:hypothetical protein
MPVSGMTVSALAWARGTSGQPAKLPSNIVRATVTF